MKKLIMVSIVVAGIVQSYAGAKEEIDSKIKAKQEIVENCACWDKCGIQKICGLKMGSTIAEINASGVLNEKLDETRKDVCGTFKKPFRNFSNVRLCFTKKGRLYYIEMKGNVTDFVTGKSEYEATHGLMVKKFATELGEDEWKLGVPENDNQAWLSGWKMYYRPFAESEQESAHIKERMESGRINSRNGETMANERLRTLERDNGRGRSSGEKSFWKGYGGPEIRMHLSNTYIEMSITNNPLHSYDDNSDEIAELEQKLKSFLPSDAGIDLL